MMLTACQNSPQTVSDRPTFLVKDAKYGDQNVPLDPQKIVSFDYGALDTLQALGLENKVAGVAKSHLPPLLKAFADEKYADAGAYTEPNYERLYALKPDLIIINGTNTDKLAELRKIAPTIYYDPNYEDFYNSFKANTEMLGKIMQKEDLAKEKLAEVDRKLAELTEKTKSGDKRALICVYISGRVSVFGTNSRYGFLYQTFGFKSADENIKITEYYGQVVNLEYFKQINPEYLFIVDRVNLSGEESIAKSFFDNDVIKSTKAFQNDSIVYVNAGNWHVIFDGIQSMTKIIEEVSGVIK